MGPVPHLDVLLRELLQLVPMLLSSAPDKMLVQEHFLVSQKDMGSITKVRKFRLSSASQKVIWLVIPS